MREAQSSKRDGGSHPHLFLKIFRPPGPDPDSSLHHPNTGCHVTLAARLQPFREALILTLVLPVERPVTTSSAQGVGLGVSFTAVRVKELSQLSRIIH